MYSMPYAKEIETNGKEVEEIATTLKHAIGTRSPLVIKKLVSNWPAVRSWPRNDAQRQVPSTHDVVMPCA